MIGGDGRRRALLLNGVVMHGDAISRSLVMKRAALHEAYGDGIQVDIATNASNIGLPGTHIVSGLTDLLCLPAFQAADLLIYEFGMFYELLNSVRFAPPAALCLAVWHNVTPIALAASADAAQLLQRSLDQRADLLICDHVFCDSAFNLAELEPLGPAAGQLSVLPLPVAASFATSGAKPRRRDKRDIRLLFVGRVVASKGVLDLVQAFRGATAAVPDARPELTIIGNVEYSDARYVARVRDAAGSAVHFAGQVDEPSLIESYRGADVLIIPSYHEGYCVPVLEAFACGCHVIAYDAGNLPSIVGECGLLVPTGDVVALQAALAAYFRERLAAAAEGRDPLVATGAGLVAEQERRTMVRRHAMQFSEGAYRENFIAALEQCVAARASAAPL
jgi:glycosyltransferase involved in cell wall biosynthesis